MAAPGQKIEACLRFAKRFAFRQNPPTDADHRIGRERETRRKIGALQRDRRRGFSLFHRQTLSERAGRLAAARGFVDLRG